MTANTTTTSYAWMITLQKSAPGGMAITTRYGTVDVVPGATRYGVYEQLRSEIDEAIPEFRGATVMFWSLEPNELPLDRL